MSGHDAAIGRLRARSAETWLALERVLDAALDAPPGARGAVLEKLCGGDRGLHAAALAWLRACDRGDSLLDTPPGATTALDALLSAAGREHGTDAEEDATLRPARPEPGTRLGSWRILREIGRGGMGIVYLAERADAEPPMRVALKVMHRWITCDSVGMRRFLEERRILAALEHPAIARLLDGGVDDGVPWFAMEYVAGEPIDAWCDRRALPVDARLRLFCRVCEAVEHAHARLVVHRDLKPANILVSDAGDPTLLDFGIAKLLAPEDPSTAAVTRPGFQPMTFVYAAPEQIQGDPPTTATDVYALGVLLYVLLAGQLPLDAARDAAGAPPPRLLSGAIAARPARHRRASLDATGRDGASPVERIAAARGTTPARLARQLHGDLDAVVGRAMHGDPGHRYHSAGALAGDVQRHLDEQPVLARSRRALGRPG